MRDAMTRQQAEAVQMWYDLHLLYLQYGFDRNGWWGNQYGKFARGEVI